MSDAVIMPVIWWPSSVSMGSSKDVARAGVKE
jgi:hypothetical protein